MAISMNVVQRTFLIKSADQAGVGTGFGIEYAKKPYILTANHVFEGSRIDQLLVYRNSEWLSIPVIPHHARPKVDLIAFETSEAFWPNYDVEFGIGGTYLGEDAFVLGFPLALFQEAPPSLNNGYPLPFAAKGCVAAVRSKNDPEGPSVFLSVPLDQGYSGGPVALARNLMQPVPRVIGFVSHTLRYRDTEVRTDGTTANVRNPANLVFCHGADEIADIIESER